MATQIKHGKIYVKTNNGWVQISLPTNISDIDQLQTVLDTKLDKDTIVDSGDKIRLSYIPEAIRGGITYGGVFSASSHSATLSTDGKYLLETQQNTVSLSPTGYNTYQGLFFVVNTPGSFANIDFLQGDWLIATDSSWEKIDNTDAVTSVNNRTGAINIYRDTHISGHTYYKGDIVVSGSTLYICVASQTTNNVASNDWKAFGRDWSSSFDTMQADITSVQSSLSSFPSYTVSNVAPTASNSAANGSIWINIPE